MRRVQIQRIPAANTEMLAAGPDTRYWTMYQSIDVELFLGSDKTGYDWGRQELFSLSCHWPGIIGQCLKLSQSG